MAKKSASATLALFPSYSDVAVTNSSTFATNMALPIHGWYRYTAGFSAEWVRQLRVDRVTKTGLAPIMLTCWWDNQRLRLVPGEKCLPRAYPV